MRRLRRLALVFVGATCVGLALWSGFPLCPLAGSFGIPCPGCGLTRATLALLHGDVRGALRLHPLVWLLSPLFVAFVGALLLELLRDPERPRARSRHSSTRAVSLLALALLVLTLGVWLLRFAGYFGGPVPVTSLHAWLGARL